MSRYTDNLKTQIADLQARNTELEQRFDRQWAADMRGIEKWRAAGEGRELKRPDRADMVAFLLEELDKAKGGAT